MIKGGQGGANTNRNGIPFEKKNRLLADGF